MVPHCVLIVRLAHMAPEHPEWIPKSQNPIFAAPVTDLTYQPMKEVMKLLRDNGFQTWIVTGGGQEFVRAYSNDVYGVPTEQVVVSSITTKFETKKAKKAGSQRVRERKHRLCTGSNLRM